MMTETVVVTIIVLGMGYLIWELVRAIKDKR